MQVLFHNRGAAMNYCTGILLFQQCWQGTRKLSGKDVLGCSRSDGVIPGHNKSQKWIYEIPRAHFNRSDARWPVLSPNQQHQHNTEHNKQPRYT